VSIPAHSSFYRSYKAIYSHFQHLKNAVCLNSMLYALGCCSFNFIYADYYELIIDI